jgi:hypothetical protein
MTSRLLGGLVAFIDTLLWLFGTARAAPFAKQTFEINRFER